MVPIHTHPPSKEYDEGWERIFGKKKSAPGDESTEHGPQDPPSGPQTGSGQQDAG
jgi:hypothetical protein